MDLINFEEIKTFAAIGKDESLTTYLKNVMIKHKIEFHECQTMQQVWNYRKIIFLHKA